MRCRLSLARPYLSLLRYFAMMCSNRVNKLANDLTRTFVWIGWDSWDSPRSRGGLAFLSGVWLPTPPRESRRIRDFLFDHIQRLSFSYHATTPTGDLIERVTSDVDTLRRFFSEQAIGMGRIILLS